MNAFRSCRKTLEHWQNSQWWRTHRWVFDGICFGNACANLIQFVDPQTACNWNKTHRLEKYASICQLHLTSASLLTPGAHTAQKSRPIGPSKSSPQNVWRNSVSASAGRVWTDHVVILQALQVLSCVVCCKQFTSNVRWLCFAAACWLNCRELTQLYLSVFNYDNDFQWLCLAPRLPQTSCILWSAKLRTFGSWRNV